MKYIAKLWWLKPGTFSKFKSHSYKSWVENNLNEQDSFSKQNLDQNSWKILMLFVFSTKIVNNSWDTTLDSRPLALKMFEAKTFEAEISDANLAHAYLLVVKYIWCQSSQPQAVVDSRPLRPKMFEAKTFEAGSLMQIYWSSRCPNRDFQPLKSGHKSLGRWPRTSSVSRGLNPQLYFIE